MLGKGNYGVVFQVGVTISLEWLIKEVTLNQAIETSTKRVLAVKRMNKNVLIDRNQARIETPKETNEGKDLT